MFNSHVHCWISSSNFIPLNLCSFAAEVWMKILTLYAGIHDCNTVTHLTVKFRANVWPLKFSDAFSNSWTKCYWHQNCSFIILGNIKKSIRHSRTPIWDFNFTYTIYSFFICTARWWSWGMVIGYNSFFLALCNVGRSSLICSDSEQ